MKLVDKLLLGTTVIVGLGALGLGIHLFTKEPERKQTTVIQTSKQPDEKKEQEPPANTQPNGSMDTPGAPNTETNQEEATESQTTHTTYQASVAFKDDLTSHMAKDYVRAFNEYCTLSGKGDKINDSLAELYTYTSIAGKDGIVELGELEARINDLANASNDLRKKHNKPYEQLNVSADMSKEAQKSFPASLNLPKGTDEVENKLAEMLKTYQPDGRYLFALNYLTTGQAPTEKTNELFESWLKKTYGGAK